MAIERSGNGSAIRRVSPVVQAVWYDDCGNAVASEAICTNLTVTRDRKQLPTLIETKAWNAALTHYIGHSPLGAGDQPQPS